MYLFRVLDQQVKLFIRIKPNMELTSKLQLIRIFLMKVFGYIGANTYLMVPKYPL